MNDFFDPTKEYRTDFINVLKQNKKHYESVLSEYTTPSDEYNLKYYKWKHPYQGNWEYNEIFTDNILNGLKNLIQPNSVVLDIGAQHRAISFSLFYKRRHFRISLFR